jgi:hypothetical protein
VLIDEETIPELGGVCHQSEAAQLKTGPRSGSAYLGNAFK